MSFQTWNVQKFLIVNVGCSKPSVCRSLLHSMLGLEGQGPRTKRLTPKVFITTLRVYYDITCIYYNIMCILQHYV